LSATSRAAIVSTFSRVVTILGVVFLLGIVPLLSGRDIAASVFRARYSEGEMTPEVLDGIRAELGLDGGVFGAFFVWLGNAVQGDFGTSWISRKPVLPEMLSALGNSLTLMLASLLVGIVL